MVFSTAFGTAIFGYLIDIGLTINGISIISALYITISLILLLLIRSSIQPVNT